MNIDGLLRPRSIAILGASERPSIGRALMDSLAKLGFDGQVFPVNPKYPALLGHACYPSLRDLPQAPDVVAFCVATERVLDGIRQTAEINGRAAVVYDGGFAERGDDGKRLQAEIVGLCREAQIALCGPNCMGVLNVHDKSTTYMQEVREAEGLAGHVGLVSQSGSICIGLLADVRRFGFSHVVSSGNEAVVTTADYLEALIDDPETKVVAAFLESVREPERFVAALDRAAALGKPVAVLKVGRSERTRRAITSHTGGLAGEGRVFSEVLRAHGAIEVDDLDEFNEVLAAAGCARRPSGPRIGVVTASGGQAELILDVASESGLELPPLDPAVRADAEKVIGPLTGDGNPLDAWGNGNFAVNFPQALKSLDADPNVDAIVMCSDAADGNPMGRVDRGLVYAQVVVEAVKTSRKPHYMMGMRPGLMQRAQIDLLRAHDIPALGGTRQGLSAIAKLARAGAGGAAPLESTAEAGRLAALLNLAPLRPSIHEADAKALFAAHGLPVTREALVLTVGELPAAAAQIGYPVALKVMSDAIPHKSDHGLVALGIGNDADLRAAGAQLLAAALKVAPREAIAGFLVQEMMAGGIEAFVGVNRDPEFGPVIAAGLGGVGIEIFKDYALRLLPLRLGDAAAMLEGLRAYPLLAGARSEKAYDIAALVTLIERLAAVAWAEREHLGEIDLNPVKVFAQGQGCRILDALIVPRQP
jgi:acyl-CoA synthetase (NDP forming)